MADPRNLSASDANRLREAFALLQQGRANDARALADAVLHGTPQSPDALHLLALCRKALGDHAGAATAFDNAIALAPSHASLLANYANFLRGLRRSEQAIAMYERVLALAPGQAEYWMNFALTLLDAGNAARAIEAFERALQLNPGSSAIWQGLGAACRASGDLNAAAAASRRAVELNAGNGAAWTNLGVIHRLLGDPIASLHCYAQARRAGFGGIEIEDAEASAYLDCGEPERALQIVRQMVANQPDYAPGQSMFARLLWEHGETLVPDEAPDRALRSAVAEHPSNRRLRLELCRFLLDTRAPADVIPHVLALRSEADEPVLVVVQARALEQLGDHLAARDLFEATYPRMQHDPQYLNMYVRHLLISGHADAAVRHCLALLEREPFDQLALAQLGLAWRLTGDSLETWLCDYDRFICDLPLALADAVMEDLRATLSRLHTARREPVDQSLRGGTQTSGMLFGRRERVIRALRDACSAAIVGYVNGLPEDPRHPFLRRKSSSVRFAGSWSVRLRSQGRHVNHFHQEGWISSALYVQLPPSVLAESNAAAAGWIQFGAPPEELGLSLPPRRIVRPREGRLVLFPSYFWHGTVPFDDSEPRITVAFDAVPQS